MIVGAINKVYSYTTSYQSQFFSSAISNDQLNTLMQQFGVLQTGDQYTDLQALYQAMYNYYSMYGTPNTQPQQQMQNQNNIPWAPLMQQVNLPTTGNLNTDYAAFKDKITSLQANPSSGINIGELEQEASTAFVQPKEPQAAQPQLSGSDIIAQLNKAFILG